MTTIQFFFILPCLEKSCLLPSYDRKLLLCLTPSEGFSLLFRSYSPTCMGAEETQHAIRPTTHCRIQLLLSSKLVVRKIYWENVSEHRAKYKEVELMREKKIGDRSRKPNKGLIQHVRLLLELRRRQIGSNN